MAKNYICLGNYDGMISYDELLSTAPATQPEVEVGENDLYIIAHTGGTTGRPKGVMLTYRNIWEQAIGTFVIEPGRRHNDIGLLITPLFHNASYLPFFASLMMGNTQVMLRRVDETSILEAIQRERVTLFVPFTFLLTKRLLNFPDLRKYDLSSIRVVYTGGAPITEPEVRSVMETFPHCRVCTSYGQTELTSISSICFNDLLESGLEEKVASVGKELFNVEVKVVDDKGKEVKPNQVGELASRGPGETQGYWHLPEETAEGSLGEGWIRTGDLGKIDEEGFVWVVDRKKDAIRSFGEYIYSQEVEDAVSTHPSVQEVAVIGVPDEKWGEAVKALVILKEGHEATEKEIIDHCRKYLSGFKCPKSVEFYSSFPRTGTGKINKVELRKRWR